MRVHVIETGQVIGKAAMLRGPENAFVALAKAIVSRERITIPVHAYIVEHPDGLIAIDTGLHAGAVIPRAMRWMITFGPPDPNKEVGPQMRAQGLRPEDVRWVIPTHLHIDHAGGLHHFPDADVLVHRIEYDKGPVGRRVVDVRKLWPVRFEPKIYDLDDGELYSFPESKALLPGVRAVPTPGHSVGHVALLFDTDGPTLFFAGDHFGRQEWFEQDIAAGRLAMWASNAKVGRETSRRIADFVRQVPTMLIPAHDPTVAARLAEREPATV